MRTVAGRLGHRNPSTTLNVYSHFVPESDRHAAAALGQIFDDAFDLTSRMSMGKWDHARLVGTSPAIDDRPSAEVLSDCLARPSWRSPHSPIWLFAFDVWSAPSR